LVWRSPGEAVAARPCGFESRPGRDLIVRIPLPSLNCLAYLKIKISI